jgi:glyoxylase-like metal-dependent hydrolase (beta-lactamase superfamily II)
MKFRVSFIIAAACAAVTTLVPAVVPANAQQVPTLKALTAEWPEIVKVDSIEILNVQKNIYMLVGGGANVTVQIGDEGVLVVDTGGVGNSDKIVAAIRHLTRKPLRFLIDTSADPDHAGDNAGIVKAAGGVSGVNAAPGHPANVGILTISHDIALNRMVDGSSGMPPMKGEAVPVSSFSEARKDFYANGEAVQVFHEPNAHEDGDVIVFFRGSDVVSTGEIFRTDSYPVIDLAKGGSIQGELNALNHILDITIPERNQMGGTRVVPAHGRICNEADVLEYRDMLTIIRDRVKAMIKKNMTLAQIEAAHPSLEYDGIYGTRKELTGDMFLEVVYNDLGGKK